MENEKEKQDVPQPNTAAEFRKRFQLGKVIKSPAGMTYRIRPIAPHFYLGNYTTQLMQFIPDDRKKEIMDGKELTEEELKKYIPTEEQLNMGKAIRPVLLEGVLEPKVIDAKAEKRAPRDNELDVDELMAVMDEAMFLFNNIHAMSSGVAKNGEPFSDSR